VTDPTLSPDLAELADQVVAGDRRSLAKAITLVESTRPDHRRDALALLDRLLPHSGGATRVGISGSPGVGKSTFIESLGLHVVGEGHRLGVLAVDPSSRRSGGSILGDKTRMVDLVRHDAAFIRPSPAGATLGGVARRTREAMLLCEAAGFDVVFIETVGVGQSETAVADLVDLFVLLVAPGGGDDLQGIKRGIMELADLVVVNKADGALADAAHRTASDYRNALGLMRPRWDGQAPPVTSVSALTRAGLDEVWSTVTDMVTAAADAGERDRRRAEQATAWMWEEVRQTLVDHLVGDQHTATVVREIEADVRAGRCTPSTGAQRLLASSSLGGATTTVAP
jgi:LAO/AO transport system kinase